MSEPIDHRGAPEQPEQPAQPEQAEPAGQIDPREPRAASDSSSAEPIGAPHEGEHLAAESDGHADAEAASHEDDASAAAVSPAPPTIAATTRSAQPAEARSPHVRAFVAINVSVHTVRRIVDDMGSLRTALSGAGAKVAWVPAANLHLTMKFLGPIRRNVAEGIRAALARSLSSRVGFELEVRGLGVFPSLEEPRILWAGVRETPALVALQQEIEAALESVGFAREPRPFAPHITIARVTDARGASIGELLRPRAETLFGTGRITEVVLYESRTLARGAEYHALARVPIGSGGAR